MVVCDTSQKPLMLFHIIHSYDVKHALVFTKSAESTDRLVRLFEYFEEAHRQSTEQSDMKKPAKIAYGYSSDLSGPERKQILERFKQGDVDMYV